MRPSIAAPRLSPKYFSPGDRNAGRACPARLKSMFSWLTLRLDRHLMHAVRSERRFGSGSLIWLTVAVWALGSGCSSGASSGGSTGEGGAIGQDAANGTGGATAWDAGRIPPDGSSASGGGNGTGGATGTGTGGGLGAGGSIVTGTGGSTGLGGAKATGGSTATGNGGANGTGGSTGSGSGGSPGTGGSSGRGGSTGAGGTSTSGAAGTKGTAGSSGAGSGGMTGTGGGTATGGGTGTGGATNGFCPPGAIFCADFEEASGTPAGNPVGTATFQDPNESGATFGSGVMELDSGNSPFDGKQSLRIDPSSGVSVRTLAVAVPATFWVRLYIKSDLAIGQPDRNSFFGAGTNPIYSIGNYVELSEQYGCVLLNKSGMLYPTGTTCGTNSALSANSWHCMTAEFDGTTGNVKVYSGTTQIINAAAWAPAIEAFNSFSFGYFAYNPNGATVWYDDVVISASPLSCP